MLTAPSFEAPAPLAHQTSARKNSLAARVEAFFVRHKRHLHWVHIGMFLAFLVVMGGPLLLPDPPGDATPLTNLRVAANYLLWGVWFPLMFLSVIFAGRAWCGIFCPMGAASEWANKVGLKRAVPRWISWEGTPLVSFLFITILGQTTGVRDHPEAAAEIFGGTMLLAIGIGFLYGRNKRVWCRHMCPIGRILGLYSRLGAVQFSPKLRLAGPERPTEKGICPTMIDLPRKTESRHCITCFRCVNPQAKGGMEMVLRRPGLEIEQIRDHNASHSEGWFLFMDTGVALGGFLWLVLPLFQDWRQAVGEWAMDHGWDWIDSVGPALLMSEHPARGETFFWLDFFMIVGFMLGCMAAMTAVLSSLTVIASLLARAVGADGGFKQRFTELAYQYTPVALVSLIISLGAELFEPLRPLVGAGGVSAAKGIAFLAGVAWSLWLGERILARQGVAAKRRWLPLLPGLAGTALTGLAWWPAIFGL